MMKLIIFTLSLCVANLVAKPTLDESDARKFIEEKSNTLLNVYINSVTNAFALEDLLESVKDGTLKPDEETSLSTILFVLTQYDKLKDAIKNVTAVAEEAHRFPIDQFSSEEIKIGITKLKTMMGLYVLGDEYISWIQDDFDDIWKKENFCKFKDVENKCKSKYDEITKVLKSTNDSDELLYYWKESRERNLNEISRKLRTFLGMYKNFGEKFGMTPKFAWFSEYVDENFGENMEKVMNELEPLYKEIHAYIRHILHEQFGDKVPATGLIPHHFFELAQTQAWKSDSIIAKDFKGVKMPTDIKFKETAKDVLEIASNFMKSLGLSEIPEEFWKENIRESKTKDDDCMAKINDSGNTTFFEYCPEVNIERFYQTHGYVARIYYANERKDLPFAYTEPFNLHLAAGEAVTLSAATPKYLHEVGHKEVDTLPESEDLNRLYRMGLHTLLSVPEYFVHVKVISDVLDSTVEFQNLNKHYWDLMEKFIGVAAPAERNPENLDFPQKFYNKIDNHNQQSANFVSEIAGYQIYKALCKKSGNYVEDDKAHELHNCNFSNSKEAGKLLQPMMQIGSKKTWRQTLGIVTGDETGMKADGVLEYFEPLKKWLHTKNNENGVSIGWKNIYIRNRK